MPISLNTLISNRTSATLADNVITTAKLSNSSVTTPKLVDGAVSTAKLDSNTQSNISNSTPKITVVSYPGDDLAADTAGGQTIIITGTGFKNGCQVYVGSIIAPSVTFTNTTSVSFTTPAQSSGDYLLYVINPDGSTGIGVPGISYSGVPTWSTAAGALANATEAAYSTTINATSDSNISYAIFSGALPSGLTLNSSTGVISGTLTSNVANLSSNTTYNISVNASDAQNQNTIRSFSITYIPTFPTWNSPNAGALTSGSTQTLYTANLNATSNSGITYSIPSGNLIANITISGSQLTGTPPEGNTYYFTIRATDAEGHSTDRNFSLNIIGADTYFNYTTLLLQGNGTNGAQNNTFLDSSTNAFTITRNGNTTQGTFSPFSQADGYWSNYFDGSGDYLSLPTSAESDLNLTGTFTLEFWFYRNTTGDMWLFSKGGGVDGWNATDGIAYQAFIESGTLYFQFYTGSISSVSTTAPAIGAWHHFAIGRNGTTLRGWLNGTSIGTQTATPTPPTTRNTIRIASNTVNGKILNGYISNLRVVNGTDVYGTGNTTITVPTAPLTAVTNTKLLTCQSNRFVDNSTNAFTITRNGDTSVQAFSPFAPTAAYSAATNGGSGYFDGAGDFLDTPASSNLQLGTSDFTIEFWTYATSSSANNPLQMSAGNDTYSALFGNRSGSDLLIYISSNGSSWDIVSGASWGAISPGEWVHRAVTRSGSTFYAYRNGVQTATWTSSASVYQANNQACIGKAQNSPNSGWIGYIAGFRILKGTALYTSAFTPSTSPPTAITNTQLLLNYTNAGITDATAKNVLETVGNAQIDTGTKKFGTGSLEFDGNGDMLRVVNANLVTGFGTGDFTVEFWVYANSWGSFNNLVDFRKSTDYFLIHYTSGAIQFYNNGSSRINGGSLSTTTWYHVAVCRSGTSTKMFVDGTQVGSTYTDSTNYPVETVITIGARNDDIGNPFNGYIDDLRITKGIARYTANFTPPSSEFQTR